MVKRSAPKPRSTPMGARSRPRLGWCRLCRAPILAATFDALRLELDPHPLTPTGELMAHLTGAKTFLLSNGVLWRRHVWAIKTSPTGIGGSLHRTHSCGKHAPFGQEVVRSRLDNSEPDF